MTIFTREKDDGLNNNGTGLKNPSIHNYNHSMNTNIGYHDVLEALICFDE